MDCDIRIDQPLVDQIGAPLLQAIDCREELIA
jgi:hypothetical protein